MTEEIKEEDEIISLSSPRLNALEKLYVRSYLSTLSHVEAHKVVAPNLKAHHNDNPFSRKDSIIFHINLALQEKLEAIKITPEVIIEKLFKEATREGAGSNHAARIQALTQLGKHVGLFAEKKDNNTHTFNIITYSDSVKVEEVIEKEEEVEEIIDENISFTTYGEDE